MEPVLFKTIIIRSDRRTALRLVANWHVDRLPRSRCRHRLDVILPPRDDFEAVYYPEHNLSQPPNPYQPQYYRPDLPYEAAAIAPAPLRRAGVLLICLGAACTLMATCVGIAVLTIPLDQILARSNMKLPAAPPGYTIAQLAKIAYLILAGGGLMYGISLKMLGYFVRRGSRGAAIGGIILSVVASLFLLCNLGGVPSGSGGNPAIMLLGFAMFAVPLGLFILACVWLTQGLRQIPAAQSAQQQYQSQMWLYQQQQAAYQQNVQAPQQPKANDPWQRGYGLTPPPPPPTQPTQPPAP
jgi:hypothetical protein